MQLQQAQRDSATKWSFSTSRALAVKRSVRSRWPALVREVAKSKPIVAVANGMAASAAYAIASGAGQIAVPPTGLVGSIGVIALHLDFSKFLEEEGIARTRSSLPARMRRMAMRISRCPMPCGPTGKLKSKLLRSFVRRRRRWP